MFLGQVRYNLLSGMAIKDSGVMENSDELEAAGDDYFQEPPTSAATKKILRYKADCCRLQVALRD